MKIYEPFAGLGAYSLRCIWEAAGSNPRMRAEPPVSRVGNKAGFVPNVFRAFGLVRQQWDEVHLNDLDPVCHLFHLLYASAELRDLVARRLYAMVPCPECMPSDVHYALDGKLNPTPATCKGKDGCPTCSGTGVQDARQLWERIRKEPVPGDVVEACAAGLYMQQRTIFSMPCSIDADGQFTQSGFKPERVDTIRDSGGSVGAMVPRPEIASRVSSLPSGLASLADVTARALFLQSRSFQLKPVSIVGGRWVSGTYKPELLPECDVGNGYTPERLANPRWTAASRVSLLPGPGACQIGVTRMDALEFARGVKWGKDCVCVLDPPYEGTTGYHASSCRADVLEIARMAHAGGALVLLHEGVGLAKELGEGWHERSASPLRARGSTFHAGGVEKEWLTSNRAPVWWPAEQATMFG